ncbi:hypothetical protein OGATHE_003523 [Ogataea polymorpha]|uniref:Uncharacterized protein n=1 Tax=Ogataea polymorpha TaxID=460523 RepID=A0A9P8P369_9ASCO|nr:hypothetical protein OGATHE_003523 [Ogataea polymorpha]
MSAGSRSGSHHTNPSPELTQYWRSMISCSGSFTENPILWIRSTTGRLAKPSLPLISASHSSTIAHIFIWSTFLYHVAGSVPFSNCNAPFSWPFVENAIIAMNPAFARNVPTAPYSPYTTFDWKNPGRKNLNDRSIAPIVPTMPAKNLITIRRHLTLLNS